MRRFQMVMLFALMLSVNEIAGEQLDPGKELLEFARGYAAAWSSQDPAKLAAFYSPGGSLKVNDGVAAIGRDAIEAKARGFMTAFPDMVVELVEVTFDENQVTFHWHWTGTNTGPDGTGNPVDLYGYEEWTIGDNGLISQSLGHYDEQEYQRQLQAPGLE